MACKAPPGIVSQQPSFLLGRSGVVRDGFQSSGGRRHRQCRARDAGDPRRARISGRRGGRRSPRRGSIGSEVSFGEDDVLKVQALDTFDFSGIDIVLSSPGAKVSAEFAPRAAKAGAVVIDNTSHFRMDPDVPLVVPEVNPQAIAQYQQARHHRQPELLDDPDGGGAEAAARPGAHQARRGRDLPVGVGRRATRRWTSCSTRPARIYVNDPLKREAASPSRSPSTSSRISTSSWTTAPPRKNGRWRSRPARSSTPTSRSPRPACACRCSSAMPRRSTSSSSGRSARTRRAPRCARRPGVIVVDHRADEGYVTPAEAAGEDAVYVSRIRRDPTVPHGLNLWVRRRQSAQGRRAQRGADRRAPDRGAARPGAVQRRAAAASGGAAVRAPIRRPTPRRCRATRGRARCAG